MPLMKKKMCRFPFSVADGDASTCRLAEFSLKWRIGFSHLRGGSYNHAVVRILIVMPAGGVKQLGRLPRWTDKPLRRGKPVSLLGNVVSDRNAVNHVDGKVVADSPTLGCGEKTRGQSGAFRGAEWYWFQATPAPS